MPKRPLKTRSFCEEDGRNHLKKEESSTKATVHSKFSIKNKPGQSIHCSGTIKQNEEQQIFETSVEKTVEGTMPADSVQLTPVADGDSCPLNVFDGAENETLAKVLPSSVAEAIFGMSPQCDDHSVETPMQQIPDEATKAQNEGSASYPVNFLLYLCLSVLFLFQSCFL